MDPNGSPSRTQPRKSVRPSASIPSLRPRLESPERTSHSGHKRYTQIGEQTRGLFGGSSSQRRGDEQWRAPDKIPYRIPGKGE